ARCGTVTRWRRVYAGRELPRADGSRRGAVEAREQRDARPASGLEPHLEMMVARLEPEQLATGRPPAAGALDAQPLDPIQREAGGAVGREQERDLARFAQREARVPARGEARGAEPARDTPV